MDLGMHGRFLIKARIESNVARVLSAMPLPSTNHSSQNTTNSNPVLQKKPSTEKNYIYTPEVLRTIFGPDAGEGKISTINRSTNPVPVLIMPNGEMRLINESQIDQIKQHLLHCQQHLLKLLSDLK